MTTSINSFKINSLNTLKLFAVLGVLVCHTGLCPGFDLCARMVEILFVVSGFLMAYNHFNKQSSFSLIDGAKIVTKKLPRFYPIHLITFLLQLFFVATWYNKSLNYKFAIGTLNLSLQHAWFPKTEFTFNNVSWFLSALIFCYFITPALAGFIKQTKRLIVPFLSIFIIRFFVEYITRNQPNLINLDLHCNPFVQSLNYSLGYITGVYFLKNSKLTTYLQQKTSNIEYIFLQLLITIFYFLCCYYYNLFYRLFFVLLSLPLIYIFALNRGYFSKLSNLKPIKYLESITLEIFMFHSFILYHFPTDINKPITYLIFLSLTLIVSIIYNLIYRVIKKHIS